MQLIVLLNKFLKIQFNFTDLMTPLPEYIRNLLFLIPTVELKHFVAAVCHLCK